MAITVAFWDDDRNPTQPGLYSKGNPLGKWAMAGRQAAKYKKWRVQWPTKFQWGFRLMKMKVYSWENQLPYGFNRYIPEMVNCCRTMERSTIFPWERSLKCGHFGHMESGEASNQRATLAPLAPPSLKTSTWHVFWRSGRSVAVALSFWLKKHGEWFNGLI